MKTELENGQIPPQHRQRRTRDRALVLLIAGIVFLMPPVATIFQLEGTVGGVPVLLAYLFAIWAGLIVGALLLSRRMAEGEEIPEPDLEG